MQLLTLLVLAACASSMDASRYADITTSASGSQQRFSSPHMALGITNTRQGLDILGGRIGESAAHLCATPEASRFRLATADAAYDVSRAGTGKLSSFTGERDLALREKGSKVDVEVARTSSKLAMAAAKGGVLSAASGKINTFSGEHNLRVKLSGSDVRGEACNSVFGAAGPAIMAHPTHAARFSTKKIHTFTGDKDMTLSDNGSRVSAEFSRHLLGTRKSAIHKRVAPEWSVFEPRQLPQEVITADPALGTPMGKYAIDESMLTRAPLLEHRQYGSPGWFRGLPVE